MTPNMPIENILDQFFSIATQVCGEVVAFLIYFLDHKGFCLH